jgi:transcriptional regulator NrdR family protein
MHVIRSNYEPTNKVERRRECEHCGMRISTEEIIKVKDKTKHVCFT